MVRKTAYEILKQVIMQNAYGNLALKAMPKSMSQADRSLVTQIVYGTLQKYDYLCWQWQHYLEKPCSLRYEILINLSIYQLMFLDRVPAYAVVNEALNCLPSHQRSFVQAILTRFIEKGIRVVDIEDSLQRCAIENAIPLWILKLWQAQYGEESMQKIAHASSCDFGQMVGRINPLLADLKQMKQDQKLHFIDEWAIEYEGNLLETNYFNLGQIVIQDYASQQVAKLVDPKPGMRVLDACSAPGTKCSMMAAMMENQGEILACDLHEHRLELIRQGMAKLNVHNVTVQQLDATQAHLCFERESFDCLLLDVPCSGLGTLRHKPDLKFHIQPEDLDALILTQKAILDSCSGLVKVGGVLVYSTCTLNRKENDKQIDGFLKQHSEYELIESQTCFPFERNQDGFYMAKLVKKESSSVVK